MATRRGATVLTGTHLIAGLIGAAIPAVLTLHGAPLAWLKQDAELRSLQAVAFDVTDQPQVSVIKAYPDGSKLYHLVFVVSAKIEGGEDLKFSYSLFSAHLLHVDSDGAGLASGLLLDAPPDPFEGLSKDTAVPGAPGLTWKLLVCAQHIDTNDAGVKKLMASAACPSPLDGSGGGMTGIYPPMSQNSYSNGILVRAWPGDFVGLSTAFGVKDCSDEDSPNCSLSQEIVQLP